MKGKRCPVNFIESPDACTGDRCFDHCSYMIT
jgi:hypothetical protein